MPSLLPRNKKYASAAIRLLQMLERVAGIEPASSAWKAEVIAIIRYPHMVPTTGIELVTY